MWRSVGPQIEFQALKRRVFQLETKTFCFDQHKQERIIEGLDLNCGQCLLIYAKAEKYHRKLRHALFICIVCLCAIFGLLIFEIFEENGMRRK